MKQVVPQAVDANRALNLDFDPLQGKQIRCGLHEQANLATGFVWAGGRCLGRDDLTSSEGQTVLTSVAHPSVSPDRRFTS